MYRTVNGFLFEGKRTDEWDLRIYNLGAGQKEVVLSQVVVWEESHRIDPDWQPPERTEADEEERRLANLRRAARRAKTRVRRTIKALGLDALLTLTYHANQTDLSLCKRHLKEFVRRIKRVLPGFRYVAAFEQQERGAWHVHMAIHRLPPELASASGVKVKSYNVVRAIWRSVVGDLGGNIDQSRRKRWSRHSVGKLAAYLSKYMLKAFEAGDSWSNRYSASAGVEIPAPVLIRWRGESLRDLLSLAYTEAQGSCDLMAWLSPYKDLFFLSIEPDGPPLPLRQGG